MEPCSWPKLARAILPSPEQVLLVSAPIDLPPERLELLRKSFTPHEHAREAKFATLELRSRWASGRGLLRALLASALGADAAGLRFRYREHGKPELEPASHPKLSGPPLTFNVSHSHGRALYALARGREVGVDLEEMRIRRSDDLAKRFYAPEESEALLAVADEDQRRRTFFYIWSSKEAFIKATGAGLSQSLSSFAFALETIAPPPGAEEPPFLAPVSVARHRGDPDASRRWSVHPLAPAAGFSGALISEGKPEELILRSWNGVDPLETLRSGGADGTDR